MGNGVFPGITPVFFPYQRGDFPVFLSYSISHLCSSRKQPFMSTLKFQTGPWSDLLSQIQNNGSESVAAGKKFVFLYVCANWSMPCRKMETDTLSDQLVGDFFNANFVNIRILMGII